MPSTPTTTATAASRAPRPAGPRWNGWVVGLVGLLVVAGAGLTVRSWWTQPETDYPARWSGSVRPYVDIVERERGLRFVHPVEVDFLGEDEFAAAVTTDEESLTDEDRAEIEQWTGLFRALGLVEGAVDLFAESNELGRVGTLGFYSYDDQRVRVRGTQLTPAVESTLVHELTHALQDQHFEIGNRFEAIERTDDDSASSAFRAVVEGDARRVEARWADGLSAAAKTRLAASQARQGQAFQQASGDVPQILQTLSAAPYALGEALLDLVVVDQGAGSVDELLQRPPTTDEQLLDPWTYVDDDRADGVAVPALEDGETEIDSGTLGALTWLLALAERRPVPEALDAVDGWGGDAYVAFDRAGTSCVRAAFRGDTAGDLRQMTTSLRAWAGAVPGSASVTARGSEVLLESCDPGTATAVGSDSSAAALSTVVTRTTLARQWVEQDASPELARCAAARVVRAMTLTEIRTSDDTDRVEQIVAPCRTDPSAG